MQPGQNYLNCKDHSTTGTTANRRAITADSLAQLDDFVLDARCDLTILTLQFSQLQEFACGFGRIAGYVTATFMPKKIPTPLPPAHLDGEHQLSL
jgi:hypothetical protein